MDKIFPSMCSKPEKIKIFAMIPAWIWVFVLFPIYMPYLGFGIWELGEFSSWLEIGYHVLNGIIMWAILSSYLKEEWFMVTTDVRYYLKHVALTVGLMLGAELVLLTVLYFCGFKVGYLLEGLPVVEMAVSHTPLSLLTFQPIVGTVVLSVFVPISICALFYCFGFAPVCYKKPWLAYLCVALITLIPPIVDIIWREETNYVLGAYLAGLPIHLLACWSYQKTDNAWTPMVSLGIANLLISVAQILLLQ